MLLSITRPRDGRPGVRSPAEEIYFFFLKSVKIWQSYSLGKGGGRRTVSSVVKGQGHDADHAPPSSTEFKNEWSYTSSPPTTCLHDVQRDNFASPPVTPNRNYDVLRSSHVINKTAVCIY